MTAFPETPQKREEILSARLAKLAPSRYSKGG